MPNRIDNILKGVELEPPQSRVEKLLYKLLENGGTGGGISKEEVERLIAEAISGVTQFEYKKVDELPAQGEKGIIYLVPRSSSAGDSYEEYLWIDDKFERIPMEVDLSGYATLDSPALTGTPTAPTPASGDNSTKIATTEFVTNAIDGEKPVFVAEYNVTTAQEIIEYIGGDAFAPILVKRGNDYYTSIITQKASDTKVSIRALGTVSGEYYVFTYTITDGTWASSSFGLQSKLASGTNIKTVNNQSLLGEGNVDIQGAKLDVWVYEPSEIGAGVSEYRNNGSLYSAGINAAGGGVDGDAPDTPNIDDVLGIGMYVAGPDAEEMSGTEYAAAKYYVYTHKWIDAALTKKADKTEIPDVTDLATKTELAAKQNTLTAGTNITIENDVISAVGSSGGVTMSTMAAKGGEYFGVSYSDTDFSNEYNFSIVNEENTQNPSTLDFVFHLQGEDARPYVPEGDTELDLLSKIPVYTKTGVDALLASKGDLSLSLTATDYLTGASLALMDGDSEEAAVSIYACGESIGGYDMDDLLELGLVERVGDQRVSKFHHIYTKPWIDKILETKADKSELHTPAVLSAPLTTDIKIGHVEAGTTFAAGTTLESILRSMFVATPVTTYTVTFNSDGGSSVEPQTVIEGGLAIAPTNPTKANSQFDFWAKSTDLSTPFDFSTPITGDITLVAIWEAAQTYTVSFNSNGGSAVESQAVVSGGTATRPANPTKANAVFENWYNGLVVFDFATPITGNITLTAEWTPTYAVSFNTDGGSAVPVQTVVRGQTATRPETDPTKEDHVFVNWYSEATFENLFDFTAPITADTVVYAKFDAAPVSNADFYVGGMTNADASNVSAFSAKTTQQLLDSVISEHSVSDSPVTTQTTFGTTDLNSIYYVMIKDGFEPTSATMLSGGISSPFTAAEIKDSSVWKAVHADVTINGDTYHVYGYRTRWNPTGDYMTISVA